MSLAVLLSNQTIVDIEYEVKDNGVWYRLTLFDAFDMKFEQSELKCILHAQMKQYAADDGWLESTRDWEIEGVHQQDVCKISYNDFLADQLDSKIIHGYLKSRGITQLSFDPTML